MNPLAPLRVAVITPYYLEALELLRNCHDSVLRQTYPATHFLVADGHPRQDVSEWGVNHITLAKPHGDVGNTPRGIGAISAVNQGFDAVCFLDADNWFYPHHIEAMIRLHRETGAAVCTASRTIHRLDGSLMFRDEKECDGVNHVDTSCYFITRAAFRVLPIWALMPPELGPIGDRVVWQSIVARRMRRAHHPEPTVAFRTQYQVHYLSRGETPPPNAKTNADSTGRAFRWWSSLPVDVRRDWMLYLGLVPATVSHS